MRATSRLCSRAASAAALLLLAFAPSASGFATLVKTWGSTGSGEGQFHSPAGLATDSKGNLYVADTGNDRIQKFSPSGTFLTQWGSSGSGRGQFSGPMDVAVSPSGMVYVADTGNDRIQRFTRWGIFIGMWGAPGSAPGQFSSPASVASDSFENVYVADRGNDRVQKFDPSGTFAAQWGGSGSGDGEFDGPRGVATDPSGNVYVSDTGNHRVEEFSSSGTFLDELGRVIFGSDHFDPIGVSADSLSNVYAGPTDTGYIVKFDSAGDGLFAWNFGFDHPAGIATYPPSRVYLADTGHDQIWKFNDGLTVGVASLRGHKTIEAMATAGTKDNLRITRPSHSVLRVTDFPNGPYTGSGVNADTGCRKAGPYTVDCRARGIRLLHLQGDDQHDRLVNSTGIRSFLGGGEGDDTLVGGSGPDELKSRSGADVMKGMGGNDLLLAFDRVSDTLINCDGRGVRAHDDSASVDELPLDPRSVIKNCESVRRG